MPIPNPDDPITSAHGQASRVLVRPIPLDLERVARLKTFCGEFFRRHFTPLDPSSDVSLEAFLASQTNKPQWWKQGLRNAHIAERVSRREMTKVFGTYKSFIKNEFYDTMKKARTITGPSDAAKALVGPWFHLISSEFFSKEFTSKGIPPEDLARVIPERIGEGEFWETDHDSFEGHFTPAIQDAVEVQFYKYMTAQVPGHDQFWDWLDKVLLGEHRIVMNSSELTVTSKRMSGDMCTSLGNTLTNLCLIKFVEQEKGAEYRVVCEGDDGALSVIRGEPPVESDFITLGFKIKMVHHDSFAVGGYCKCFPLPSGGQATNPLTTLVKFPWLGKQYLRANDALRRRLLRLKAMSILASYRCPVITPFAQWVWHATGNDSDVRGTVDAMRASDWERDWLITCLNDGDALARGLAYRPTTADRVAVEELFGIPVGAQELFERTLSKRTSLGMLDMSMFVLPADWADFHSRHVLGTPEPQDVQPRDDVPAQLPGVFEGLPDFLQRAAHLVNL